jgi:hypothetical protein
MDAYTDYTDRRSEMSNVSMQVSMCKGDDRALHPKGPCLNVGHCSDTAEVQYSPKNNRHTLELTDPR